MCMTQPKWPRRLHTQPTKRKWVLCTTQLEWPERLHTRPTWCTQYPHAFFWTAHPISFNYLARLMVLSKCALRPTWQDLDELLDVQMIGSLRSFIQFSIHSFFQRSHPLVISMGRSAHMHAQLTYPQLYTRPFIFYKVMGWPSFARWVH